MGVIIGAMEVKTQIEKDDSRKNYYSFKATCTKNTETALLLKIPGTIAVDGQGNLVANDANDRKLFGGRFYSENAVIGDYIKVDVVDHDNALGAGVDYQLASYSENPSLVDVYPATIEEKPGILIYPDGWREIIVPSPARLYGGTWLRVRYVSHGIVDDVIFHAEINWDVYL